MHQASLLTRRYDAVIANPPYMGSKYMMPLLRLYALNSYANYKSDIFAMFMHRCKEFTIQNGQIGLVTPYVWMFISSYELLRKQVISQETITSLIQLEYNAFEPACVPVCAFTLHNHHIREFYGSFIRLSDFKGHESQAPKTLHAIADPNCGYRFETKADDFERIPGNPIAYWLSRKLLKCFQLPVRISDVAMPRQGLASGDNGRFLRLWHEVDFEDIGFGFSDYETAVRSGARWFPHEKGGAFRKWYGNKDFVIAFDEKAFNLLSQMGNSV